MLDKVLIANRGEIAVRVIRACRELGIRSVAVFSDADRYSPHVLQADEAHRLGPAPSAESYLRAEALIDIALRTGCDAVHPGYGFLSERAFFAEAVEAAGLVFVGPPASAIAAMGDKTEARRRMQQAGVPVVPGSDTALDSAETAASAAAEMGYPVMLKAAAGGGGKGMRVVTAAPELKRAFTAAANEARSAFGDGRLYLEKFLMRPRHIEIQVLADAHGNIRSLGERECSIQRRHQKLLEEAPSPAVTSALRAAMSRAAVAAARAVQYRSAGTIEFLVAGDHFFFLEMNTRIQVEHPVTELVTGIDLVQWQLHIAAGDVLALPEAVGPNGHALECRITGEDPYHGFLPSAGRIEYLEAPAGPGVRWDGGIMAGQDVPLHYDPLLGKLIVHAADRDTAVARMRRALAELRIIGIDTSVPFHQRVLDEPDFLAGRIDIGYLDAHPELLSLPAPAEQRRAVALAAALLQDERRNRRTIHRAAADARSGWRRRGWRD
jgi:acetyl-CoA carboxylase biotin carboxylase subunit